VVEERVGVGRGYSEISFMLPEFSKKKAVCTLLPHLKSERRMRGERVLVSSKRYVDCKVLTTSQSFSFRGWGN